MCKRRVFKGMGPGPADCGSLALRMPGADEFALLPRLREKRSEEEGAVKCERESVEEELPASRALPSLMLVDSDRGCVETESTVARERSESMERTDAVRPDVSASFGGAIVVWA